LKEVFQEEELKDKSEDECEETQEEVIEEASQG